MPDTFDRSVVFSDGAYLFLADGRLNGGTTFTDLVPVLPDSSIEIWAIAGTQRDGSASVVTWTGPASASPLFRFAQPPTLLEPANGAGGLPVDAELSWASATPGAAEADVDCWSESDRSTFLHIRLVTGESSVRLPDLAAFGLTYPPGAQCYWSVVRGSQLRDVDSYLGEASRPALPSSRTTEFSDVRWFYPP